MIRGGNKMSRFEFVLVLLPIILAVLLLDILYFSLVL